MFSVDNGDPWGSKKHEVTILDVRDGWVRYDMGAGSYFRDNRIERDSFLRMYKSVM